MASVRRYKNGDGSTSYVAQVRIQPFKPIAKSFPTKPAALDWADDTEKSLRKQRERGADRSDLPALTVKTLVDEFLADSETKALRYVDDLERLCAWWVNEYGSTRVADLGVLKLRAARDKLKDGGETERGAATINRYLSAFRSCWNWGRTAGLIPQERGWPSRLLLTEPRGRTRYLTDDELEKLIAAARKHSALMYAAVVVSLGTGMRQGELLRLEWKDVDFARQRVRILETKNDQPRAVHLPAIAVEALKALKAGPVVGQRSVFFFASKVKSKDAKSALSARWKVVRKNAGLEDFRWHDLRHSCASFLAQKGATLLEIGSVLGHKSPSVTMRYSHLVAGAPVTGAAALDDKLRNGSR
jgi:integrase